MIELVDTVATVALIAWIVLFAVVAVGLNEAEHRDRRTARRTK